MSLDAINHVMKRSRSTGAARLVLMAIAYHADRTTGHSYASRRLLAEEANVSTATIHAALAELLEAGEIEIVVGGSGRKATTYRIGSDSAGEPLQPIGSDLEIEPQEPVDNPVDNSVVAQSPSRSGSIHETVAAQSGESPIGRTEKKNKIEPKSAGVAAPTGAAPRSNPNGIPPDAAAAIAEFKQAARRVPIPDLQEGGDASRDPDAEQRGSTGPHVTGPAVAHPPATAGPLDPDLDQALGTLRQGFGHVQILDVHPNQAEP